MIVKRVAILNNLVFTPSWKEWENIFLKKHAV